ncbi:MAG: hypothetical protein IPJ25_14865 [Rhodocyclaceae bacterium]|nr:hypothetical protein [Rhodocyclaceae bacterium]
MRIEDEPLLQAALTITYDLVQVIDRFGLNEEQQRLFLSMIDLLKTNYTLKGRQIKPIDKRCASTRYRDATADKRFQSFKAMLLPVAQSKRGRRNVRKGDTT